MKRIDLKQAGDAEAFGALAVSRRVKHRRGTIAKTPLTPAQARALSDLALSFMQTAKQAGGKHKAFSAGDVSFEWHEDGMDEILSIRIPAAL